MSVKRCGVFVPLNSFYTEFRIKAKVFVESRLSNVELDGVNGVKRGKSHQNLTAAQAAIQN